MATATRAPRTARPMARRWANTGSSTAPAMPGPAAAITAVTRTEKGRTPAARCCAFSRPSADIFGVGRDLPLLVGDLAHAIGIAAGDGDELVLDFQEGVDDLGVKVRAAPIDDDLHGLRMLHALLVDATADQGVIHVGQRHQARRNRDGFASQPLRVAAAIPFLVVAVGDLLCILEEID